MKHQLYVLRGLDKHTRKLIVDDELANMLSGQQCTICNEPMDDETDAVCSGVNPLTYAHVGCWQMGNI